MTRTTEAARGGAGRGPTRDRERLRRRAALLREMDEARALRGRVAPRRSHLARQRELAYMRTFQRAV
jgi:hypothetical protein